jgi:hypothetical protein
MWFATETPRLTGTVLTAIRPTTTSSGWSAWIWWSRISVAAAATTANAVASSASPKRCRDPGSRLRNPKKLTNPRLRA